MRKSIILLATCLAALPVAGHADVPVIDIGSITQQLKSYEQELKSWILQNSQALSEAKTELNTAKTYLQEVQTYLAFVEHPNLRSATGLLNAVGLRSDLPVDPMAMASIVAGFNSLSVNGGTASLNQAFGLLNTLGRLTSSSYARNHVYTCQAQDPICADINARANGIAGSMGTMQATYADLQQHQAIAQSLRDQLAGTTDPALRETVMAQLQAEMLYTQNLAASQQAAMAQAQLQAQSYEQRNTERQRQSADQLLADTQPITTPFQ